MSDYRRIAVLDIGKTNAKVVVIDSATGAEIAAVRTPNTVIRTDPYPHYDIEALWAFTLNALKDFARTPGFDAISITTHGAAAALLGSDGRLAMPVIDYEHEYPQAIRDAYDALRPAFSETFSPRLPMGLNVGAQLHYQKTAFPAEFARVRTILTYAQYWSARLTGVTANELTSLGCHTDLWNPRAGTYSSLVDRLGIHDRMAPIRSAFDTLGPVLPEIAEEIGISVPVYCGIHDSNASLLPHLVGREAPFAVVSTGTWVINFAVGGDLDHLDPKRDALANVDAYGRAVPSSRFMGGREFEMLTHGHPVPSAEAMTEAFRNVVVKQIMLLPNVVAGSGPFPGRQMRWLGEEPQDAAERYAAASIYAALMTEACLELIGAGGTSLVEGPFAANREYLVALAALTGRPVTGLPGATGTAHGAAMLTGAQFPPPERATEYRADGIDLSPYRKAWYAAIAETA
ncbi:FGGY-family carbohydrate kinase [Rhizobium sp. BK251]|uniref:FGGY-family carbohydrate kinase n=1 Tax=Rhizobium sp. BK251 TaxID=2512125 RepID=UPI001042E50F|nr:FGGY-family carbohydrate kinase [Rhizobium sp. BK251]TCL71852.1 sugar (pentulose or hexulose) kinase [Rhizobium sp. BK251]